MGYMSLVLVIGFTTIIFLSTLTRSNITQQAYENAIIAYDDVTRRNIALSALNIASAELYKNMNWRGFTNDIDFGEGVATVGVDTFSRNGQPYIKILSSAQYGKDWRGNDNAVENILSTGSFERFSRYVFFADKMFWGMRFLPGDSIIGVPISPISGNVSILGGGFFHANDTIPIANSYIFYDNNPSSPIPKIFIGGGDYTDVHFSLAIPYHSLLNKYGWAFRNGNIVTDNEAYISITGSTDRTSPFSWQSIPQRFSPPVTSLNYHIYLPGNLNYTENAAKNGGLYIGPETHPFLYTETEPPIINVVITYIDNANTRITIEKTNGSYLLLYNNNVNTITSNGVICIKNAKVIVSANGHWENINGQQYYKTEPMGTGKFTIASTVSSEYENSRATANGRGSIYPSHNIVYADTTSLLGLVAYWDVLIRKDFLTCYERVDATNAWEVLVDSAGNYGIDPNHILKDYEFCSQYYINKNYRIDASIFALKGGFGAEGIDDEETGDRPTNNRVTVYGGIVVGKARMLGKKGNYSSGDRNLGYRNITIRFNQHLLTEEPPYFPVSPLRIRAQLD